MLFTIWNRYLVSYHVRVPFPSLDINIHFNILWGAFLHHFKSSSCVLLSANSATSYEKEMSTIPMSQSPLYRSLVVYSWNPPSFGDQAIEIKNVSYSLEWCKDKCFDILFQLV